nr:translation initiation factor IF-2-like [Aegilops tauschii subsp. strangulata]
MTPYPAINGVTLALLATRRSPLPTTTPLVTHAAPRPADAAAAVSVAGSTPPRPAGAQPASMAPTRASLPTPRCVAVAAVVAVVAVAWRGRRSRAGRRPGRARARPAAVAGARAGRAVPCLWPHRAEPLAAPPPWARHSTGLLGRRPAGLLGHQPPPRELAAPCPASGRTAPSPWPRRSTGLLGRRPAGLLGHQPPPRELAGPRPSPRWPAWPPAPAARAGRPQAAAAPWALGKP